MRIYVGLAVLSLAMTASQPSFANDEQARAATCITMGGRDPACAGGITGTVQAFKVLDASRLRLGDGMDRTNITAAAETGGPGDWIATGIFIAEQAMVAGSGTISVELIRNNPWGASIPMQYKWLARINYDSRALPSERWNILASRAMPTIMDIEADKLHAEISNPDVRPNLRRRGESAQAAARRLVIEKYGLPPTWQITSNLGTRAVEVPRSEIRVTVTPGIDLGSLRNCLSTRRDGIVRCN